MSPASLSIDLLGSGANAMQNRFCERQRDFSLSGEHGIGASLPEFGQVSKIGRPREDADPRIHLASHPDNLSAVSHSRRGQDQIASARYARRLERFALGGVSVDRSNATVAKSPNRLHV